MIVIITILFSLLVSSVNAADIPLELERKISEEGQAEYFVVLNQRADLTHTRTLESKIEKGQFVFDVLRETADRSQKDLRSFLDNHGITYKSYWIRNMLLVKSDRSILESIVSRSDVSFILPNRRYQVIDPKEMRKLKTERDARGVEWNISQINADKVWSELGVTGENIVVCDNDTGVDWQHPALRGHYRGWDGSAANHSYNWFDVTGTSPLEPIDDNGHGTHTTGTMVGDDGSGNQIGVAPGARWIGVKTMDAEGSGEDQWFFTAFQWILAPTDINGENPDPGKSPHIINNSWGFFVPGDQEPFGEIAEALMAAGIFFEASAGNEGPGCATLRSPADHEHVFTTGATSQGGVIADFSSRGPSRYHPDIPKPEIVAPGVNIRSSVPGGTFGLASGTSMAGPHTCGIVALIWSANQSLIGDIPATREMIQNTAVRSDVDDCSTGDRMIPNNVYGYGEIDCYQAVIAALPPLSTGRMTLNKAVFMCSDSLDVMVFDSDLAGIGVISINAQSSADMMEGETVYLAEGDPGVFAGSIPIEPGMPAMDGTLQVNEGSLITVTYEDADHGGSGQATVTKGARIDCTPPIISNVKTNAITSKSAQVTWDSNELTTTSITYGKVPDAFDHHNTHFRLNTRHQVVLTNLEPCTIYYFQIEAQDEAGNLTIFDQTGVPFEFETYKMITVIEANMDENPGWTITGGNWEWGKPTGNAGDPTSGFTGDNVYGYNLDGPYENNMPEYALESPSLNLTNGRRTTVSMAFWINIDSSQYDHAKWQISLDAGNHWFDLWENFDYPLMMDFWYPIEVELGSMVDGYSDVRFRWTMGPTDATGVYGGVNIDDFKLTMDVDCDYVPPTPTPVTTGVRIDMPTMVHPGDDFFITGYLDNPDAPLSDVAVFFILEVYGHFWFWPSWAYFYPPDSEKVDYQLMEVATGTTPVEVMPRFEWPDTGSSLVENLHFYGAMLNENMDAIRGDWAMVTWGYGP